MEENQRSTDMATGRGKAIRLRWEKMRRWTSPAWKERQAVLTENDDARGKKAAERRDGRGGRPWAHGGAAPGSAAARVGGRTGAAARPVSRRKAREWTEENGRVLFFIRWELALARHGLRGGKNARHTFAAKICGGMVP